MKGAIALMIVVLVAGCGGVRAKSSIARDATLYPPNNGNICLLAGSPASDVKYEVLGRVVATKRTYGSSDELFPPMAQEARKLGADAIINLQASQRFKGPLPWRVTSPTGDGQAIKVLPDSPQIDCLQMGGKLWGPGGGEVTGVALETGAEKFTQSSNSVDADVSVRDDTSSETDLYTELMKLDDLRKKGILTEEEFDAEKRKLLEGN
jgi:hypothetical protein